MRRDYRLWVGLDKRVLEKLTYELDVLMVWHAYMLNPRAFAEDCLRLGKMDFWAQGMPWEAVNAVIDPATFEYRPPPVAMQAFEGMTGRKWDSLAEPNTKRLLCPKCCGINEVPWNIPREKQSSGVQYELATVLEGGKGFAEADFDFRCKGCNNHLTHKYLQFMKFKRDVGLLEAEDVPLPGTILSMKGIAERVKLTSGASENMFPNSLVKKFMLKPIMDAGANGNDGNCSMEKVRDLIEPAIKQANSARNDKTGLSLVKIRVNNRPVTVNLISKACRISIRRMMSRYWGNSSQFALDLVGAVIRQGEFM
jgi:hypothetical protein